MLSLFFSGISCYSEAFSLLTKPQTLKYVLWIGLISIILGFLIVGGTIYNGWASYVDILATWDEHIGIWEKTKVVLWEILPLIVWVLLSFLLYKNIVLIVCSPIISPLSAAVEKMVRGKVNETPIPFGNMISRSIHIALWSTLREILFTLPCLLLNLIPVIGSIAATVAIFIIQSYYAGANYSDFILERRGYNTADSIAYIRKNRPEITGIGAGFVLMLFLPLIGFIIAPAASTIAATLSFLRKSDS